MRTALLALAVFIGVLTIPAVSVLPGAASVIEAAALQEQPPGLPDAKIDVDIDTGGGGAWYADPVWIVVGAIALVVLVVLVAVASRGGGTTVVRG